ncbi:transposase [filamentous cyanobacterium LEGE 11480]|uniref:Transposase n=1 Tax=Romeriopsis navalis LEGE 11480 TaxID=2777977 RepID=A0A928VQL2_9CYAN|nr:transposase [Romeriopsis navalis]MBE9030727.1 transposase [Romeriopsis navalis LEGE 11480]
MRPLRIVNWNYCYHVTIRCNNREFRLTRRECRQVFLYALSQCRAKFGFKLYGLCVMSNHVHYLIEPRVPEDLPRVMHWLNWYSAMCFNRMLNRTGHFWEKRYHSTGFPNSDYRRALNTLRYIHGNPKAAAMQPGFFYDFSNYGIYDRLTVDGLTQWHPAFLALAASLELCAAAYRQFCRRYQPQPKSAHRNRWGSKLLAKIRARGKPKKVSPGQKTLWDDWDLPAAEILAVAEKFVQANQYPQKPPDP